MDHQPRSLLRHQKKWRTRLIALAHKHKDWVVGFQDEVWFSRLAQPQLHTWSADKPLRLENKSLPCVPKDAVPKDAVPKDAVPKDAVPKDAVPKDAVPKALACYGLLRLDTDEMMLRFVEGRPVSDVTIGFLRWVTSALANQGKRVLVMVWDNARWHTSGTVKLWIKAHNRKVKRTRRGCRLLVCRLPTKSPWLNNIEPKWQHGKKNTLEPNRILSVKETKQRLCRYYKCPLLKPLRQ